MILHRFGLILLEEIARQMQNSGAAVVVCIPQMEKTMEEVAELCPSIRRMIVIGTAPGFVSISDMFQAPAEYFDDNMQVSFQ